ncbi:MAG: HNH endonuclease [Nitrososphaerales archaeon]
MYCGTEEKLALEHILPQSRGGPDEPSNTVLVCGKCNSRKGSKRPYEWFGLQEGDYLPRITEGKYLKLLFDLHRQMDKLSAMLSELCPRCDLSLKCPEASKLTVYCLEGLFLK